MNLNLKELILEANQNFKVIWHFNVSDISMIRAIFDVAYNLKKPVILGVSEGERNFFGVSQIVALVKSLRAEYNFPIFLNADHSHSFETAKQAIDLGFDAVIFDGSRLSLEENISETRRVVEYKNKINPDILIEGELGYIGAHSEVLKDLPEGAVINPDFFTKPEEAKNFILQTGVDLFSPAVGNVHGIILKNGQVLNPKIDTERIFEIKKQTNAPLVLHGGSGIPENDFILAVKSGINIIHISTELRLAWRNSIEEFLKQNIEELAPYKILSSSYSAVYKIIEKYLKLM
jgi:fructose-bisphosphate aldolase class II